MSNGASNAIGAGGIGYAITIVLFDWVLPAAHVPLPAAENMADVQSAITALFTVVVHYLARRGPQ